MSDNLMTSRRFAPLFWCQFFSAFNDNFLKNALVFLILFSPAVSEDSRPVLITLTAAVFIGPFFFLSGLGGQMADRFDKAIVAYAEDYADQNERDYVAFRDHVKDQLVGVSPN